MLNSMDPDQARLCGGTDPGPNMIQFAKVVGRRHMQVPLIHMSLDIGSGSYECTQHIQSSIFLLHKIYLEAHMTVNPARVARGSIERLKQEV